MKKRIIAFVLIMVLSFSQLIAASANSIGVEDDIVVKSRVLYDLSLLKGTTAEFSVEGLELDRNATRAEACITILRLLGKESKANYQQNQHPFSDVPAWASNGVGWLYESYLVNGVSDTYFGAQDIATVQQFSAMLLRVLGYDDKVGDFSYDGAVQKAVECGILTKSMAAYYELSRENMIEMCYNALNTVIMNSTRTLIRKLCDERAVNKERAENLGLLKAPSLSDVFPNVAENLGFIRVEKKSDCYCVKLSVPAEEYGLRVFVRENGKTVKDIPYSGSVYAKKGRISYQNGSAAGYLNEISIYGLDQSKTYSFIVVKTTSHGEYYDIVGKSTVAVC